MAAGPSRPELAAAVSRAGGLGFLAAGYLTAEGLREQIQTLRGLTHCDFGVNLFVTELAPANRALVDAYAARLEPMARQAGVELGAPRCDDDHLQDKLAVAIAERVPVVSFTFGLPSRADVGALHGAGAEVWVTVTSPEEAQQAAEVDADALVVQGVEAGGHRGVFIDDDSQPDLTLLVALELISAVVDMPLIAAGGLMTGAALAAALEMGASAGQLGTAYLRCDEAGTSAVHRAAVATSVRTVLTRAYSGLLVRGIANSWHEQHGAAAPRAYPEVHHLTAPLRARGRGDPS